MGERVELVQNDANRSKPNDKNGQLNHLVTLKQISKEKKTKQTKLK